MCGLSGRQISHSEMELEFRNLRTFCHRGFESRHCGTVQSLLIVNPAQSIVDGGVVRLLRFGFLCEFECVGERSAMVGIEPGQITHRLVGIGIGLEGVLIGLPRAVDVPDIFINLGQQNVRGKVFRKFAARG